MHSRFAVAAMALALSPAIASATTTNTVGNQVQILYDSSGTDVLLPDFNLATGPVDISAEFLASNVDGSLTFGVFSNPAASGAAGSLNINIVTGGVADETFSGSFDGSPLVITFTGADHVATISTTFSGASDVANFFFDFSGFDLGSQFHVNVSRVSAIPLPASLPLLLGALGGLGFLSRRRKAPVAA